MQLPQHVYERWSTVVCRVVVRKDVAECEELVLNAVATINNLSYYAVDGSCVTGRRLHIAECKSQAPSHLPGTLP